MSDANPNSLPNRANLLAKSPPAPGTELAPLEGYAIVLEVRAGFVLVPFEIAEATRAMSLV
jgi:hypothetical protein